MDLLPEKCLRPFVPITKGRSLMGGGIAGIRPATFS